MQDLTKIKEALQDRVVSSVARETGINRNTIGQIKTGKKAHVNRSTYNLLMHYLGLSDDGQ